MYYFEAHYINMDTDKKITRIIGIDCQRFCDEEEIYIYAMRKAYGMKKPKNVYIILNLSIKRKGMRKNEKRIFKENL